MEHTSQFVRARAALESLLICRSPPRPRRLLPRRLLSQRKQTHLPLGHDDQIESQNDLQPNQEIRLATRAINAVIYPSCNNTKIRENAAGSQLTWRIELQYQTPHCGQELTHLKYQARIRTKPQETLAYRKHLQDEFRSPEYCEY